MSRLNDEQLDYVLESLHDIDFGTIQITVHEGQITQIDTTEKKRFQTKKKTGIRKKTLSYTTEN